MAQLSIITKYKRQLNKAHKKWIKEIDCRFDELQDDIFMKFEALEKKYTHQAKVAKDEYERTATSRRTKNNCRIGSSKT